MPEMRKLKFGDLGQLFDGPHATPTRRTEGPFFLNIASLKSGRLDLSESDHVSDEDFTKWTRRVTPEPDDLLFSYETRLGEAALVPDGIQACLGRRMALLRPNRANVDPRYLLYFYLAPNFQRIIAENTIQGATVTRIGLASMPNWEVEILADIGSQRRVAEALGALDDKIAANRNVIHRAETLAAALACRASRRTELAAIAKQSKVPLQPASFENLVAHYSLPAFDEGAIPAIEASESIKSSKFAIEGPAVLISKLNPRIPRLWDVSVPPDRMALASTEFVVLEPIDISSTVLWSLLRQPAVTTELAGKVAGTSGSHQRVKPSDILTLQVGDPSTLGDETKNLITGIGQQVAARRQESIRLAATRDALLPLLMSGQIQVRDAETAVEEVV